MTTVVKCMENLDFFLRDGSPVTVVMDPVLRGSPAHERLRTARSLSGAQWVDLPPGGGRNGGGSCGGGAGFRRGLVLGPGRRHHDGYRQGCADALHSGLITGFRCRRDVPGLADANEPTVENCHSSRHDRNSQRGDCSGGGAVQGSARSPARSRVAARGCLFRPATDSSSWTGGVRRGLPWRV